MNKRGFKTRSFVNNHISKNSFGIAWNVSNKILHTKQSLSSIVLTLTFYKKMYIIISPIDNIINQHYHFIKIQSTTIICYTISIAFKVMHNAYYL